MDAAQVRHVAVPCLTQQQSGLTAPGAAETADEQRRLRVLRQLRPVQFVSGTFRLPGIWPAAYSSGVRTSSSTAPGVSRKRSSSASMFGRSGRRRRSNSPKGLPPLHPFNGIITGFAPFGNRKFPAGTPTLYCLDDTRMGPPVCDKLTDRGCPEPRSKSSGALGRGQDRKRAAAVSTARNAAFHSVKTQKKTPFRSGYSAAKNLKEIRLAREAISVPARPGSRR